jgi:hypothetical protein
VQTIHITPSSIAARAPAAMQTEARTHDSRWSRTSPKSGISAGRDSIGNYADNDGAAELAFARDRTEQSPERRHGVLAAN